MEQAAEEDRYKKSQKTDEAGADRATSRKTPQAASKSAASKSVPKAPSKASARTKGPQKKAARKPANRRKERPESFKVSQSSPSRCLPGCQKACWPCRRIASVF